ncbi:TPA: DUF4355 domain-containing protein [Staphylococcus aureus]|uniref:DUF4355 domain-containing protein n=1 Tax=Staphylococcus TaxID=1279 RepID=UPI0003630E4E|nr:MULTISPECIES: DUF4355 domain-containing protein [Staphylococcus]ETO57357.1 phage capsid protein [Staphylococcus aureus MUM475]MBU6632334.1 DUF4355 domain-containing protein [Staphylococcus aureus]MBU6701864.1 DUF4355 domain-containing protein [Staphylococcus aureus]MBU6809167.1 DUF4355 domain-containing protein [Staphylococcus aureus]MBW8181316.1 DUF4355 domain-containing protein [Staphylococcus aureus]
MDIQEKLKLKLQFFAEESDEDNGELKDNNDDEGKDKQDTKTNSEEEIEKRLQEEYNKRLKEELSRRMKQKEKEKQEAVDEAKRLAKMNKDQIAEYEREQMEKELEQLRSEKQLNEMRSEARKMLSEAEVDSSDEVVNLVVTDTAEQTKLNVEAFSNAVKKAVNEAVKVNARQSPLTGGDSFNHSTKNKPQNLAEIARQKRIIKN